MYYNLKRRTGIRPAQAICGSNYFDLGSDEYFQLQRDTAYKRMNVDSSFVRIPYIVEKKKKITT